MANSYSCHDKIICSRLVLVQGLTRSRKSRRCRTPFWTKSSELWPQRRPAAAKRSTRRSSPRKSRVWPSRQGGLISMPGPRGSSKKQLQWSIMLRRTPIPKRIDHMKATIKSAMASPQCSTSSLLACSEAKRTAMLQLEAVKTGSRRPRFKVTGLREPLSEPLRKTFKTNKAKTLLVVKSYKIRRRL